MGKLILAAVVGLVVWNVALRRQLEAARMRGDMYRDISTRLDRRVAELSDGLR
ncbi:MAG TPA: hypothetical protein VFS21_21160 [Roseiflexaceae bacterium]|nr:hypothetical protein [Roseiflexaceae bacterium]